MDKITPDNVSRSMQLYYQRAFDQIMGALVAGRKSPNYWKKAQQVQLLKQIAQILDQFKNKTGHYLKDAIYKLGKYESELALEDLKEFKDALNKAKSWHAEYNERYVQQVFEDTFQHIAGQTERMKQAVKTSLRNDAQHIFRKASIEGTSRAKAYRTLRDTVFAKDPDFRFIDKAGRKWDSRTYFDMLTKTVMANTQRAIYANTIANEGHDLVRVTQNGAKDACKNWEGKILSLTGATEGYPTLDEATATGEVFHPNCKHRFVAYDPEIDDFFKKVA